MALKTIHDVVLSKQENSTNAKDRMLEFLRQKYDNDKSNLKIIEQFHLESSQHTAIWFYTQPSFLHRIVNKALRKNDWTRIFIFSDFILNLDKQLQELSIEQNYIPTSVLYRGQLMKHAEFEKLKNNRGGHITFNNFLSTSSKEEVALLFAGAGQHNDDIRILFCIDTGWSVSKKRGVYAYIGHESSFPDEEEYLFARGNVFVIRSIIVPNEHNVWRVNLLLTNEFNEHLNIFHSSI